MHAPSHPVPGRLRLRFTQLKQQTVTLGRMAAALHAIVGVLEVETSPLTGSLLIHYDAATGKTMAFWDQVEAVLLAHQLLLDPRPMAQKDRPRGDRSDRGRNSTPHPPAAAPDSADDAPPPTRQRSLAPRAPACQAGAGASGRLAGKFAGGITAALVEKLIERSAIALVAVLF